MVLSELGLAYNIKLDCDSTDANGMGVMGDVFKPGLKTCDDPIPHRRMWLLWEGDILDGS